MDQKSYSEAIRKRLEPLGREASIWFSVRCGLRALPALDVIVARGMPLTRNDCLIPMRCLLTASVASHFGVNKDTEPVAAARSAAEVGANFIEEAPIREVASAVDAATLAAEAAFHTFPSDCAVASSLHARDALSQSYSEVPADLENLSDLRPLWTGKFGVIPMPVLSFMIDSATTETDPWSFWKRWYESSYHGRPLDWMFQRKVALIPDEEWDKGHEHIAKLIAEIEARLALRESLHNLRDTDRRVTAKVQPPPRGHNNPPEMIDEPQLAGHVEIVWAALDTLEKEAQSESPDTFKAKEALLTLKSWFLSACQYAGRKADLVIDTTIKWAIPTVGGGYLVTHPEKLAKIIELAEVWLKH